jgi:hypothetical protein
MLRAALGGFLADAGEQLRHQEAGHAVADV